VTRRVIVGAVVVTLIVLVVGAVIGKGPSWVVQNSPCATTGHCLKGSDNPVLCIDHNQASHVRQVQVTADTARVLHAGDPCPTQP
jgi:hypothetical protein